jgi:hypothetical protein
MIWKLAALLTSLAILSLRCHESCSRKEVAMEDGAGAGELKREGREEKRLNQDANKKYSALKIVIAVARSLSRIL